MFDRLRKHFVLTTMSLLSVVLVISFGAIYVSTASRLSGGPANRPIPIELQVRRENNEDFFVYFNKQRKLDADKILSDLAITLTLVGGLTLVAGYFISRYLADRAIKPVRDAYSKQKQFIADASHELKTPIAVIDSSIEAELSGKKLPSKWLGNIQSETERMNKLVSELLTLSKLDASEGLINTSKFNPNEVVQKIVDSTEAIAREKSIRMSLMLDDDVLIESDKDKIHQILTILIDNAIKYTKRNGKVEISTEKYKNQVKFIVKNSHKTIPIEKLERLFDRFYQVESSHAGNGHGLGLSIAKASADSIGAKIEVSQSKGYISFVLTV